MAATSVTGRGFGTSVPYSKGPDGGNTSIYLPLNGPHIVWCGEVTTEPDTTGSGNWQVKYMFPEALPETPDKYGIFAMQSDFGNNDGRNNYPPHMEKLDEFENNEDDGFEGNFGGFILHTGDNDERRFMVAVVRNGFLKK